MINFPVHLLKPAPARHWPCRGPSQQAAIHIPLHPFTLQGEVVETSIRLDDIALDLTLKTAKPIVLQGDQGLSQKSAEPGNASY